MKLIIIIQKQYGDEKTMLNWIERYQIRRLQKRIIRMENMQWKLKKWLKIDRKEAKKLMMNDERKCKHGHIHRNKKEAEYCGV